MDRLPSPHTAVIRADLAYPDDLLGDPEVRRLIDFREPGDLVPVDMRTPRHAFYNQLVLE
jgi:hypothetical protein